MSSCEKKLNGYVNLKRTVEYQSTIIGKFACYILACLSSCLITEWLQLPHEATSSCHRVSVYCTVSVLQVVCLRLCSGLRYFCFTLIESTLLTRPVNHGFLCGGSSI